MHLLIMRFVIKWVLKGDGPVVTSTGMTVFEHPNHTSYLEDRDGKMSYD